MSTGTAFIVASARRTAVSVEPSHHAMSVSVPGPKARSHASTSPAVPSASERGSSGAPSHADIAAQRGRDAVQGPALVARTTAPAADSTVSTRGPIAIVPPHALPSPYV